MSGKIHSCLFSLLRSLSLFSPSVGGSLPIIPMYFSEFIYSSYRGPLLGVLSIFWMFGALLCGALAWLLLPLQFVNFPFSTLQIHTWRLFIALSAVPSIVGAVVFFLLPESPRYLLEVRDSKLNDLFGIEEVRNR